VCVMHLCVCVCVGTCLNGICISLLIKRYRIDAWTGHFSVIVVPLARS